MDNKEFLQKMYKIVDMGSHSCKKLLEDLKDKDNKIIDTISDIDKEYLSFKEEILSLFDKYGVEKVNNNSMAKMGSSMEMKMEVMNDNSDAKIADMLIRGNTMGVIEIEKDLNNFEGKVDKELIKVGKKLLEFQNNSITKLKEYL